MLAGYVLYSPSGKPIDLESFAKHGQISISPESFTLTDIAHNLAHINRFCGGTTRPLSVAEHSLHVADVVGGLCGTKEYHRPIGEVFKLQLAALLHDAAEAYLGDIPTPVKMAIPEISRLERAILLAIGRKYGIEEYMPPGANGGIVTIADRMVTVAEGRTLCPNNFCEWANVTCYDKYQYLIERNFFNAHFEPAICIDHFQKRFAEYYLKGVAHDNPSKTASA